MILEGLFERVVEGVETVAMPISSALSSARCTVNNIVTDIETDAKCRAIDREFSDSASVPSDKDKHANTSDDTRAEFYKEMFERIAQHEDFNIRNPVDIALEMGYSEEDVKSAFEYMQQIMRDEGEKD